ncbi:Tyrosinase [Caballeronia humi]|uniref:Tyrosinase n=2 Tax=Caballeronia humi TaxID=326474 RepID=A0A158IB94_9BURK|nr:Tyrosinase [Caballeronia humi]
MSHLKLDRRTFLGGAASALSLAALPSFGQTGNPIRVEWQQFKLTSQYASFLNAIATMRANTNASDPNSWLYWVNVHVNYCPHKLPYFLAWHRGYMWYFERQLKLISGDSYLTLPYWDWYTYPTMPAEFTDTASGNPLYVPRVNTNVYSALDLTPFQASTVNFQRGTVNSFEERFETRPHNPIHNIIGNVMSQMTSPTDPIFYLHHCNVDRLWHAWALPDGRTMPVSTSPYWTTTGPEPFVYAPGMTMPKVQTYSPRRSGTTAPYRTAYDYANATRPLVLPPQVQVGRIIRVQASTSRALKRPPVVTSYTAVPATDISADTRSIGGVKNVALGTQSVSVLVTAEAASVQTIDNVISATTSDFPDVVATTSTTNSTASDSTVAPAATTNAQKATKRYRSVKVVFDKLAISAAGAMGGYFYNVYMDLPDNADIDAVGSKYYIGTLGAFEIASAAHHGSVTLEYPATAALVKGRVKASREHVISLVRVDGTTAPKGQVIAIGEMRVELSTDAPFVVSKPQKPGRNDIPY